MGLFLDIVIIALLGTTIFYAMRLSRHLDVFRSNRSDMERLIRELSMQITRAQEGVTALDDAAKESGDELRDLVNKSRALSEELALMNEAGNSLAERLEGLATRNRVIADEIGSTALNLVTPGSRAQSTLVAERRPLGSAVSEEKPVTPYKPAGFMIRDPDFSEDSDAPLSKEDRDFAEGFESQSERDLAAAMRRRKQRDS